jgi:hypothetical protein
MNKKLFLNDKDLTYFSMKVKMKMPAARKQALEESNLPRTYAGALFYQ